MRPKGVADGQQVDIPAPDIIRTVGTQVIRTARESSPGQAWQEEREKTPFRIELCDAERKKVVKCPEDLSRKAAIV